MTPEHSNRSTSPNPMPATGQSGHKMSFASEGKNTSRTSNPLHKSNSQAPRLLIWTPNGKHNQTLPQEDFTVFPVNDTFTLSNPNPTSDPGHLKIPARRSKRASRPRDVANTRVVQAHPKHAVVATPTPTPPSIDHPSRAGVPAGPRPNLSQVPGYTAPSPGLKTPVSRPGTPSQGYYAASATYSPPRSIPSTCRPKNWPNPGPQSGTSTLPLAEIPMERFRTRPVESRSSSPNQTPPLFEFHRLNGGRKYSTYDEAQLDAAFSILHPLAGRQSTMKFYSSDHSTSPRPSRSPSPAFYQDASHPRGVSPRREDSPAIPHQYRPEIRVS
jgi:hypothetical protein